MPISLDKQLIHVRIPNESDPTVAEAINLPDNEHHGVSYYLDKYSNSFTGTKKFCIVRNTWDRFTFFFELIKENAEFIDHDKLKDMSFEEFLTDFEANRNSYGNPCWHPQTAWFWTQYGPVINHIFVEDPEFLETPQVTPLADQINLFLKIEAEITEVDREAAARRREMYYTSQELVDRVTKLYEQEIKALSFVYESTADLEFSESDLNILEANSEDLESLTQE